MYEMIVKRSNKNKVVLTFSLKMSASIIATVTPPKEMSGKQVNPSAEVIALERGYSHSSLSTLLEGYGFLEPLLKDVKR